MKKLKIKKILLNVEFNLKKLLIWKQKIINNVLNIKISEISVNLFKPILWTSNKFQTSLFRIVS